MSQWDKLIAEILSKSPNLRFEELYKVLIKIGYTASQPKGGSSHYIFRKAGCVSITIPKHTPLKRVYIELVADAVRAYFEEESV